MPVLLLRWSSVCGVCGVFSAALVFSLVPCSSFGTCGFAQLPYRRWPFGVSAFFWPRLPALLLRWWRRLGLPPFPCVLSTSPTPAGLPMFAGFCSLCQGAPIAVVAALCMAVWWYLMAPRAFRALLVVLSSPPVVLRLCGCCALFTV